MAVFAIGDVQGCYDGLRRLLDRIRFDPIDDELWFCGDLVNRGPASVEVLRFVRDLGERAISVLGNHDLHLIAAARDRAQQRASDTFADVLDAPDADELIDWLQRRPLLHHDRTRGFTLVHAGLAPQWDLATATACAREVEQVLAGAEADAFFAVMYGDQPDLWSDALTGVDRWRFTINCLTRLRFVTTDGRLALAHKGAPETAPAGLVPWFEYAQRRSAELHVIFGHWSTLKRDPGNGVYPLDTGCVWGGRLTALQVDEDGAWFSVDCAPPVS